MGCNFADPVQFDDLVNSPHPEKPECKPFEAADAPASNHAAGLWNGCDTRTGPSQRPTEWRFSDWLEKPSAFIASSNGTIRIGCQIRTVSMKYQNLHHTADFNLLCAASYAPPQRPPVVNPYAAGQTCPNGQPPPLPPPASPCNASVCSQPCGRYPTSQCVADACDSCKAKYNLNVSGPSFSVFRVAISTPGTKTSRKPRAFTSDTPTPQKNHLRLIFTYLATRTLSSPIGCVASAVLKICLCQTDL